MQIIRYLSKETFEFIEAKRDWFLKHYTPATVDNYKTLAGKFTLLDTILKSNWIEKQETWKLQSLGITLGDILVQDMNFIWVEVEENDTIDPALNFPDTTMLVFPMTMISKRVEKGEVFDIYDFYETLKEDVNRIKLEA